LTGDVFGGIYINIKWLKNPKQTDIVCLFFYERRNINMKKVLAIMVMVIFSAGFLMAAEAVKVAPAASTVTAAAAPVSETAKPVVKKAKKAKKAKKVEAAANTTAAVAATVVPAAVPAK
jgi:hypothetical protein